MKFGVITDCQYADRDEREVAPERKYRLSPAKLQAAVDYFNTQDIEFVIHLGDLIDQRIESFVIPLEILKSLKHPIHHVLGNHDFDTGDREEHLRLSLATVLQKLGMKSNYYSFINQTWRFIVLDTNELGVIEGPNDSPDYKKGEKLLKKLQNDGKIYAHPWNGTISDTQQQWFESELQLAQQSNQSVIVFAHHQLHPENRDQVLQPERIHKYFKEYDCIKAFLNGHNHKGDYVIFDEVHCVTFKGMLDTTKNSYAVVEVSSKAMKITGHGREISREVNLR
jgi:manganese-dependent ADP-ribose/CDP-alcohol diphosphatase